MISRETAEAARRRYKQEQIATEALLHDHMSRSSLLLKQVRSSVNALYHGFSIQKQSSYAKTLNKPQAAVSDDSEGPSELTDGLQLPCFPSKGDISPSSSKQMTQAAWIAQMSTVHSNLSKISSWEDTVKIPEILLTDPADVLCDTKSALTNEHEEEKDMLSQLLNDTSYEIAREADISNSYRSGNLFFANMASILNYQRKDNKPGQPEGNDHNMVDTLLNETFKGLEVLSHEWPSLKGGLAPSMETLAPDLQSTPDANNTKLSDIETLYMKTFGTKSGVLKTDKDLSLTHALLHINEMDKNKEAELAPKMCTTKPKAKPDAFKENKPVRSASSESTSAGFSSDGAGHGNLLDGINILSEEKLGIKLNKLSDFERKFVQKQSFEGTNVEVQTEEIAVPEPVEEPKQQRPARVKVLYAGKKEKLHGVSDASFTSQISVAPTAADFMAESLIKSVQPRLEMPLQDDTTDFIFAASSSRRPTVQETRARYMRQLQAQKELEIKQWREKHDPLYATMFRNERAGLSMSAICRGGRKGGSRLTRRKPPRNEERFGYDLSDSAATSRAPEPTAFDPVLQQAKTTDNEPESLIYQSPSEKIPPNLLYESPSNKILERTHKPKMELQQPSSRVEPLKSFDDSAHIMRDYYGYDDVPGIDEEGLITIPGVPFFAENRLSRRLVRFADPTKGLTTHKDYMSSSSAATQYKAFNDFEGWWKQNSIPPGGVREQLSI